MFCARLGQTPLISEEDGSNYLSVLDHNDLERVQKAVFFAGNYCKIPSFLDKLLRQKIPKRPVVIFCAVWSGSQTAKV